MSRQLFGAIHLCLLDLLYENALRSDSDDATLANALAADEAKTDNSEANGDANVELDQSRSLK